MKKLYSLFAAVVIAATVNAQGTETFEAQTALTTSYASGSFTGETTGVTVNYANSRDEATYPISGKGIMIRYADSYVEFVIPDGAGTFSFDYRKAFTGTSVRQLEILVDGTSVVTGPTFGTAAGEDTTVYSLSTNINKTSSVTVRIKNVGTGTTNKQTVIDNVSWTVATLAVNDINKAKKSLVKATSVTNELVFAAKSDVKVFNTNGQIVKSASVNENTSLNVNDLPKGMYIVSGTVDGEAVSQKVIKK